MSSKAFRPQTEGRDDRPDGPDMPVTAVSAWR
jgi:hypothetical protein